MRTLAGLVFIAAAAAGAVFLAQRDTVADGSVIAADLLRAVGHGTIERIECDPRIPIGREGARFHCTAANRDGSTATYEVTMSRKGAYTSRQIGSTEATHTAAPGDPWD